MSKAITGQLLFIDLGAPWFDSQGLPRDQLQEPRGAAEPAGEPFEGHQSILVCQPAWRADGLIWVIQSTSKYGIFNWERKSVLDSKLTRAHQASPSLASASRHPEISGCYSWDKWLACRKNPAQLRDYQFQIPQGPGTVYGIQKLNHPVGHRVQDSGKWITQWRRPQNIQWNEHGGLPQQNQVVLGESAFQLESFQRKW